MDRALFSMAFVVALAASGFAQESSSSVRVITAGNGWQVAGKQLQRGKTIANNAEITAQSTDFSLLLDCGDEPGLLVYRCNASPCRVSACSINAPGLAVLRVDVSSQGGSASEMSNSLLRHEPKQPAFAGVRAQGNPNDAVLLQNSGVVQFGPALNRVLEGEYCLRLTPIPAHAEIASSTVAINWNRDTDPEGNASAPSLSPGLYSLEEGVGPSGACQVEADAVPAWVVIAPQAAFTKLAAQWKTMAAQIAHLPRADVGGDVLLTLRHAALASLADSMTKQ